MSDSYSVSGESSAIPVTATYPVSGPTAGPFPVVVIAHGFQIPASAYDGYAHRLATFGYVALNADYPASLFSPNHAQAALDVLGALDWASAQNASQTSPLAGLVDVQNAGITGHSLGGKLSILAAAEDTRVKAVIALDPVDDASNCSPAACPSAASRMPLAVPTGFLGETLDEQAGFGGQACAPANENFQSLYALASTPSLEVDVLGADHMSFLDSTSGCLVCGFCQTATAPQQQVIELSRAMVAAFYERYLRGDTRYDDYLVGATAQQRYVATSQASIAAK
ncbi:MAG: dienelactone hydrolase family protein [Deltaproteobacteria bacterium]|nr:dienelactone hydrolase family protein [Deltaproteobacteria bacterium]